MQFDLVMSPEKTEGSGFGARARRQMELKFENRTYSLNTIRHGKWVFAENLEDNPPRSACSSFIESSNGAGSPVSDKQAYTGVFKGDTYLTLTVVGSTISAVGHNDVDKEVLSLEDTITPNRFTAPASVGMDRFPRETATSIASLGFSYPSDDKTPSNPKCRFMGVAPFVVEGSVAA